MGFRKYIHTRSLCSPRQELSPFSWDRTVHAKPLRFGEEQHLIFLFITILPTDPPPIYSSSDTLSAVSGFGEKNPFIGS